MMMTYAYLCTFIVYTEYIYIIINVIYSVRVKTYFRVNFGEFTNICHSD